MKLRGTAGVGGLAKGPAEIWSRPEIVDSGLPSGVEDVKKEIRKLEETLAQSGEELDTMIESLGREGRSEEGEIIQFQRMLLMDPEIVSAAKGLISTRRIPAEGAYAQVMGEEISRLLGEDRASEGEDYFVGRVSDYRDLLRRVTSICRGADRRRPWTERDCILVSRDVTPTEIIQWLDTGRLCGLVLEKGGVTSHAVLIASARKLPSLLGLGEQIRMIRPGDLLLVDGDLGEVIVRPTREELAAFDERLKQNRERAEMLEGIRRLPATTSDGFRVNLEMNLGHPDELDESVLGQIDGIGLWRTEFLFLDQVTEPGEKDQVRIYRTVSETMGSKPVNIRTLDVGGDKAPAFIPGFRETNPNLGIRGVRLGLRHESLLKRQLRAILRANSEGNLRVMLPMVSHREEVERVHVLLSESREELIQEGHDIQTDLPLGIMIEVPSVALGLDLLIPLVDFLSVGTNDLIQYVLALDRDSEGAVGIYSPFYPPVLRLLKQIVETAKRGKRSLAICGDMASQPLAVPLLIGLGFDRLSVSPGRLMEIKFLLQKLDRGSCQSLAGELLQMKRREEIEKRLSLFLTEAA